MSPKIRNVALLSAFVGASVAAIAVIRNERGLNERLRIQTMHVFAPNYPELTTCPLHQMNLVAGNAPIRHGYREPAEQESAAFRDLFRYSRSSYDGGCVLRDEKEAKVLFCPKCREAEETWRRERKLATSTDSPSPNGPRP